VPVVSVKDFVATPSGGRPTRVAADEGSDRQGGVHPRGRADGEFGWQSTLRFHGVGGSDQAGKILNVRLVDWGRCAHSQVPLRIRPPVLRLIERGHLPTFER